MSETSRSLNFIEQIIEEDLQKTHTKEALRFRFPPEPNGYLHIGHASSICLNFGLGLRHNAPVNLRFDDTNPAKEEKAYVDAIKSDVSWLGFKWDTERYASNYFQQLYDWAVLLIKNDKAYVDSQTSEAMAEQKGTPTTSGKPGPYRNRSVEENLKLFEGMKAGEFPEGTHVLRAKIDMESSNMLMRDPIIYRVLHKAHHRTNTDWCIYPMYDWTHGESDYIEQVSHSLCTLEFLPHRELYDWFLDQVYDKDLLRPKQREFARRNLSHTVVSKRKLLRLVEDGVVNGWDDPRMPTISGLRRRGYTPESIRNFVETIGIGKRDNLIDVSLLEFHIREHLNKTTPRVMGVLDPLKVVITNYPEGETEWLTAENSPEDDSMGEREVPFSGEIYIEQADFKEEANKKFFRLKLGHEVRLKNGYIIKAETCTKDTDGNITERINHKETPLPLSPEDDSMGEREVPFSGEIYIEQADFKEEANKKFFRLKLGHEVRLKNGYIIKAETCTKDTDGNITEVQCTYDPKSKSGSGTEESLRKVKGTLHWVSIAHALPVEIRLYDRLFTDESPDTHKDKDFMEFINQDSLEVITGYVEPSLASAKVEERFQFQRMGYFCVDPDSTKDNLVFNRTVGLRDSWAKIQEKN
eukprot:maker-scaffold2655_size13560-snap-gene-0.1 protein:Tk11132 transcript:maker-scaffold2655_size13560-snap-gene-0.1-mRNA-1 annotation:"glutaminyl-trna synthetase"